MNGDTAKTMKVIEMKPNEEGKYICPKCKGEIYEDTEEGTVGLYHYNNEYEFEPIVEVCGDCMDKGVKLAEKIVGSEDLYPCDICGKKDLVYGQQSEEEGNGLFCQGCTLILVGILKG